MSTVTASRNRSKSSKTTELTVSLCLSINHQAYMVTPIEGIQAPEVLAGWRLEKKGPDGQVYDVVATTNGHECDCADFETRRRGLDAGGCKHIKAVVRMGLLPAPVFTNATAAPIAPAAPAPHQHVRDEFDEPATANLLPTGNKIAPVRPTPDPLAEAWVAAHPYANDLPAVAPAPAAPPCCPTSASAPCQDCLAPSAETIAPMATVDAFPPDRLDPWDAEAPAELWPDDTDSEVWTVTGHADEDGPHPDADLDHLANVGEPSESDLSDFADWKRESAARDHLDRSRTLSLLELIEHQVAFYRRAFGNAAGDLLASHLDELAFKVRMTEASTPAEYLARVEIMDRDIRHGWMDAGAASARSIDEPMGSLVGHPA
jgi:hypothetical protein